MILPDDGGAEVRVPLEILKKIAQAVENGSNPQLATVLDGLPGMARFCPTLNVSQPIHELAMEMGRMLSTARSPLGEFLFRQEDKEFNLVTVDEATGKVKEMRAGRLVGWSAQFCAFKSSGRSNRIREGLSRDDAALVMEQDIFSACLRPLTAVHEMRLPVLRKNGAIEFLPPGYDNETGIFTCEVVRYEDDWTMERGRDWFEEICHEMPWNGMETVAREDRKKAVRANRSFAVHVAACVGQFCRAMFPEGTLRPMFAYFANKPGSGKTRLAEMALAPLYGFIGATTVPKEEDKMDVKLETVARARRPYVLFDDIGGALRSQSLNKFLTGARQQGRCFGKNDEIFDVPNVTQVFVTANELPTSADLSRRALIAELFLDVEVQGRKFKRDLTPAWLASDEVRAKFLAAACAVVRHWIATGSVGHGQPLATFEPWTGAIGGMIQAAGLADPLQPPEMDVGGGQDDDEVKKLYIALATMSERDRVIDRAEVVTMARNLELLQGVIGCEGEDLPDKDQLKRLGKKLQQWRAQKLVDEKGRRFQIGHKRQRGRSCYPLLFLPAAPVL